MILGLQIISVFFSLLMIYYAVINYKRQEINRIEFMSWTAIWCFTLVIIIFPEILRTFSRNILITRLFDLLIVGGFVLVIVMVSRTYVSMKRLERKLEELVRNDAIKNAKSK